MTTHPRGVRGDIRGRGMGWRKDPVTALHPLRGPSPGLTRANEVRMDDLCGLPLNQFWASACVGFTIVEVLQLFYALIGRPIEQLSPWHAYWLARAIDEYQLQDGGAFISSGFKGMQHVGCAPHSAFPFTAADIDDKINLRPPQSVENAGIKFADFQTQRIVAGVDATLDTLQLRRPIAMGTNVTEAFVRCDSAETIPAPKRGERRVGGHAFMLCGFDRGGARLLAKNSWGEDYGFGGYMWLEAEWIDDPTTQDIIAVTGVKEAA